MARVEITKYHIAPDGNVIEQPYLPSPSKYVETPPPMFLAPSPDGNIHTVIRHNGSPKTFDVFQADSSVNTKSYNVENIDHIPAYHAGVISPDNPMDLLSYQENGQLFTVKASVVVDQK